MLPLFWAVILPPTKTQTSRNCFLKVCVFYDYYFTGAEERRVTSW